MEKNEHFSPIVLCMIQARMDGKRFPGKVLENINGMPIISLIIKRASKAKVISKIIVVTSKNKKDDVLVEYLERQNIEFFRGSEDNVLERFYEAAKKYNADYIIRLTGDNPFVDPKIINKVVSEILGKNYEYVSNDLVRTFPLGFDVEVLTFAALEKIIHLASKSEDYEHVTLFIRNNLKLFSTKNIFAPINLRHPDWRLTVDESNDLELIQKIMKISSDEFVSFEEIMNILENNQDLISINSHIKQKTTYHN